MKKNLAREIKETLYGYVAEKSFSNTVNENTALQYFLRYFEKEEYFQERPQYYGAYPIEDDYHKRSVAYAMLKGKGSDTVVLVHHFDVVTVEDFKSLKDYAFSPDELEIELMKIKDSFSEEIRADLESKEYLFGRGCCDMKGGGAIQMALLREYCRQEDFKGNIVLIGVPDEENLSAGMRAAVSLLAELKEKYRLDYKMMFNSEPHQRKDKEKGVFSFGSIGKLMPYFYVRGYLAHAGKVFEGFNPVNLMSEIVRNTELNMELSDVLAGEAAPPPTWLYLRENKLSYDVSMPLNINACLSVLTLNQGPKELIAKLKNISDKAFEKVIEDMNLNYAKFLEATGRTVEKLPWKVNVCEFGELCEEARKDYGLSFDLEYKKYVEVLKNRINKGESTLIMANFELVEFVYNYIKDLSPRVIIGLVPPYYPNVSTLSYEKTDTKIKGLYDTLNKFCKDSFAQEYTKEYFYTGISDLSYCYIENYENNLDILKNSMPFFNIIYHLPLEDIKKISMPGINIGPWGKDFHKVTERVLKEDLYVRTPAILDFAIQHFLSGRRVLG